MDKFRIEHFNELSAYTYHRLINLRERVFVVEQNCPYVDADELDLVSYHIWLEKQESAIATARIIPLKNRIVKIGRVCIDATERKKGIAKKLMQKSIEFSYQTLMAETIELSAQTYLIKFYEDLGFITQGEEYLEDDLPHIKMMNHLT